MIIAGIVVLVLLVGLILLMTLGGIAAYAMGGSKPPQAAQPVVNPFFTQFENALQTVSANARAKAMRYDLAKQQELYDTVMAHPDK